MVFTRITNSYLASSVFQNTNNAQAKLLSLQEQLATGKRVQRPSDDSTVIPNLLNVKNNLEKIETYDRNIQMASAELDVAENAISGVVDDLQRAHTLLNQATNELNSPSELKIIADEIDQLISNIVNLANTNYNDKFIFSGSNINLPAYSVSGDDIQYQGTSATDDYQFEVQVQENLSLTINEAGETIFGEYYLDMSGGAPGVQVSTGIIGHLKELSTDLRLDPPDFDLLRDKLDVIDDDVQQTLFYQTNFGHISNILDNAKNQVEREKINLTEQEENLEDIDMLQVSSDIQFQEIALQASLSAASKVIQPSLLNFLG